MEGKIFFLKIKDEYIRCETSCTLNITKETVAKSNRTNGKYRAFRSSYISWTATAEAKVVISSMGASSNSLIETILNEEEIDIHLGARINNVDILECWGKAIPTSFDLTAPAVGEATTVITFQGSGELFTKSNSFFKIINAMPADADKPNVIDLSKWG